MKKLAALLLVFVLILGLCSCKKEEESASRFQQGSIEITADNLPKIAVTERNAYIAVNIVAAVLGVEKTKAKDYITVCKSSDECYGLLAEGKCELVIAHEMTEKAKEYFEKNSVSTENTVIARDALVFTVCSKGLAEDLTLEQLTAIYSDRVLNWNELGLGDAEIRKFKSTDPTTAEAFLKHTGIDAATVNVPKRQTVTEKGTFFAELEYDNTVNAITFALYSDLQNVSANKFGERRVLMISGVKPGASTVQNGEYSLTYDILLTSRADLEEFSVLKLFKDWILSDQGTKVIQGSGVILPLNK